MMKWLAVVTVVSAGCAPAYVNESAENHILDSVTHHETVPDVVDYRVASSIRGDSLVLAITQAERCADIEITRVHRTTHTERKLERNTAITFWVIGGVLELVGIPTYFNADNIAKNQNQSATDMAMMTTPHEVRITGVSLMALGGVALAIAGGTHLRAIDTDRDDGVITNDPVRKEHACHERATGGADFAVLLNGTELHGRTDGAGHSEIALTAVAGSAIPRAGVPFAVTIGSSRTFAQLSGDDAVKLDQTLAGNPMSRLARERCTAILTRFADALAQKPGRAEVVETDKQLKQVKSQCPTPDEAAQVGALRGRVTQRAIEIFEEERREAHAAAAQP